MSKLDGIFDIATFQSSLEKQCKHGTWRWKKYWVSLQDKRLFYHKEMEKSGFRKSVSSVSQENKGIDLTEAKDVKIMKNVGKRFCFEIIGKSRNHIFCADTEQLRQQWCDELGKIIKVLKNNNSSEEQVRGPSKSVSVLEMDVTSKQNTTNPACERPPVPVPTTHQHTEDESSYSSISEVKRAVQNVAVSDEEAETGDSYSYTVAMRKRSWVGVGINDDDDEETRYSNANELEDKPEVGELYASAYDTKPVADIDLSKESLADEAEGYSHPYTTTGAAGTSVKKSQRNDRLSNGQEDGEDEDVYDEVQEEPAYSNSKVKALKRRPTPNYSRVTPKSLRNPNPHSTVFEEDDAEYEVVGSLDENPSEKLENRLSNVESPKSRSAFDQLKYFLTQDKERNGHHAGICGPSRSSIDKLAEFLEKEHAGDSVNMKL